MKELFKKIKNTRIIHCAFTVLILLLVPSVAHGASVVSNFAGWVVSGIDKVFASIGLMILQLTSWLLWVSGILLNYVFRETVLEMSNMVDQITIINQAWVVFRDFANMLFIFILIYIAIQTILEISSHSTRGLLVRIIIAALLINFSLFFTKIIIDASNIVAAEFYSSITIRTPSGPVNLGVMDRIELLDNGLSAAFMNGLGLQTVYDSSGNVSMELANLAQTFIVMIGGSVLMLIAAWSFFAAAFLLALRFVMLVFLMVTSPIAFLFGVIPGTKGMSDKWWSALKSNALFAPLYMALTWFVLYLINSPAWIARANKAKFVEFLQTNSNTLYIDSLAGVLFNYVIVIIFMFASLIIAKSLGMQFAVQTIGYAKRARGFIARNTLGQAGKAVQKYGESLETDRNTKRAWYNPLKLVGIAGTQARRGGVAMQEAKYGAKLSRKELDTRAKTRKRDIDTRLAVAEATDAIMAGLKEGATDSEKAKARSVLAGLSDRQLVQFKAKVLANKNIADGLSTRQLDAIERAEEYSDAEKMSINNAKYAPLSDAVSRGSRDDVKNLLAKYSDNDLGRINIQILENPLVASQLTRSTIDGLERNPRISSDNVDRIKLAYIKPLEDALGRERAVPGTGATEIQDYLSDRSERDISKLDIKLLSDKDVVPYLFENRLRVIARNTNEVTHADRVKIGDAIRAHGNTHPAYKYITTGTSANLWKYYTPAKNPSSSGPQSQFPWNPGQGYQRGNNNPNP